MKIAVPSLIFAVIFSVGGCSNSGDSPELLDNDIRNAIEIPNDGDNLSTYVSSGFQIRNQTIVFPDDDLYQVLTASDFRALCEGGAFCSVAAGQYIVVNLDTGERHGPLAIAGVNPQTAPGVLPAVEYIEASIYSPDSCQDEYSPSVELSWPRVASATGGAIDYTVSLNRQAFMVTSEPFASFRMSDIAVDVPDNAEIYRFSVSASTVNELATAALAVDVTHPVGISVRGRTLNGKPADNRTTHGFALWDNMSRDQQCSWPTDCLFATDQWGNASSLPKICFSPNQRELIHPPNFRFPLPGDNESNNVEAIDWAGGNGMLIIADVTRQFGESAYELSYFEQAGTFSGTFPVLQSVTGIGNNSPKGVNLDGKDIREVRGLQNGILCPQATSIYLIGEYYERLPQSNAATLDGWVNVGAFASKLDARSGRERALNYYPGRTQESLSFSELPDASGC